MYTPDPNANVDQRSGSNTLQEHLRTAYERYASSVYDHAPGPMPKQELMQRVTQTATIASKLLDCQLATFDQTDVVAAGRVPAPTRLDSTVEQLSDCHIAPIDATAVVAAGRVPASTMQDRTVEQLTDAPGSTRNPAPAKQEEMERHPNDSKLAALEAAVADTRHQIDAMQLELARSHCSSW